MPRCLSPAECMTITEMFRAGSSVADTARAISRPYVSVRDFLRREKLIPRAVPRPRSDDRVPKTLTITLPGAVDRLLAQAAQRRGMGVGDLAAALVHGVLYHASVDKVLAGFDQTKESLGELETRCAG